VENIVFIIFEVIILFGHFGARLCSFPGSDFADFKVYGTIFEIYHVFGVRLPVQVMKSGGTT
jgi:hypothetical protein